MRIYLSYRKEDSFSISEMFKTHIIEYSGRDSLIMDVGNNVPRGVSPDQHIRNSVAHCDMMFVLIGPEWAVDSQTGKKYFDNEHDPVRVEIEAALYWEIPIICLLVKGTELPHRKFVPHSMHQLYHTTCYSINQNNPSRSIRSILKRHIPVLNKFRIGFGMVVFFLMAALFFAGSIHKEYIDHQAQHIPPEVKPVALSADTIQNLEPLVQLDNVGLEFTFRPGREQIAFLNDRGDVELWDYVSGERNPLSISGTRVLAFSPGGLEIFLIHNTSSQMITIYSPKTGTSIKTPYQADHPLYGITNNAHGNLIASWGIDEITVWDTATRERLFNYTSKYPVARLVFSPAADSLYVMSKEINGANGIYQLDLKTGTYSEQNKFECTACFLYDMVVDVEKNRLYALYRDEETVLVAWDFRTQVQTSVVLATESTSLALSPDGRMLALAESNAITFWDTISWQPITTLRHNTLKRLQDIQFDSENRFIAVLTNFGRLTLWGVED